MAKERVFLADAVKRVQQLNNQRKTAGDFRQEAKILHKQNRSDFFKGLLGLEKDVNLQKAFDDWKKYKSYKKDNFRDLVGATLDQAKGALGVIPAVGNSFGRKAAEIAVGAGKLGLAGLKTTGKAVALPFVATYLLGGKVADIAKAKAGEIKTSVIENFKRAKSSVAKNAVRAAKNVVKNVTRFKNWVPDTAFGQKTRVGWEYAKAIGRQTGKDLGKAKGLFGKAFGSIKDALGKATSAVKDHYADELAVAQKNAATIKKPTVKVVKRETPQEVVTRMRQQRTQTATLRPARDIRSQSAGIPTVRAAQPKGIKSSSIQKSVKPKKIIRPQHRK